MRMKISKIILIFFSFFLLSINAAELDFKNRFLPLKDFLILKYDLFIQKNLTNVFRGGGITGVAYQDLNYNININKNNIV